MIYFSNYIVLRIVILSGKFEEALFKLSNQYAYGWFVHVNYYAKFQYNRDTNITGQLFGLSYDDPPPSILNPNPPPHPTPGGNIEELKSYRPKKIYGKF